MTHYDILEVHPEASEEEIRRAYRKRIFDLHPDRNSPSPHTNELIHRINLAYWTLSDPARRSEYNLMFPGLELGSENSNRALLQSLTHFLSTSLTEHAGLFVAFLISPLVAFSLPALSFLTILTGVMLLCGIALEILLRGREGPRDSDDAAFERRAVTYFLVYLLGWFVFCPFETQPRQDLVFSLLFAQGFADLVIGVGFRMQAAPSLHGFSRGLAIFFLGALGSGLIVLQLITFLDSSNTIRLYGAEPDPWGSIFIVLFIGCAVSTITYSVRGGRSPAPKSKDSSGTDLVSR